MLPYIAMKVSPPLGSIDSGMPNAPELLPFLMARPSVGAGRFTMKVHRRRRSKFRDAKCAGLLSFIVARLPGGAGRLLFPSDAPALERTNIRRLRHLFP